MLNIKIFDQRLLQRDFEPAYATPGSAGIDLRACIHEPITIAPGDVLSIPAGFAIHLNNRNLAAHILPRSGLGIRNGIVLANLVGLIDSDYQGQLIVGLWNRNRPGANAPGYTVRPMERIAQLVILPVVRVELNAVLEFPEATARGEGGFGSTGT